VRVLLHGRASEYGLIGSTMIVRSASLMAASQPLLQASAPTPSRARSNSDTVVGGVLGGVLFLILAVAVGIHIVLRTGWSRRQKRSQIYALNLRTPDTTVEDPHRPLSGYSGSSKQRTTLYLCSVCVATRFHFNTIGRVNDIEKVDVEDSPDGGRKAPKPRMSSDSASGGGPSNQPLEENRTFDICLHCHHCNCNFCQLDNPDCPFSVNLDRNFSKGVPPNTEDSHPAQEPDLWEESRVSGGARFLPNSVH